MKTSAYHVRLLKTRLAIGSVLILCSAGALAQEPAPPATQATPTGRPAGSGGEGRAIYGTYPAAFTQPEPLNFNDHEGYTSLFDGVSLKGWEGETKLWAVEDGAIVGGMTPVNGSNNTFLVYRDLKVKDFTLKLEIRIEGGSGSGIQYRSQTAPTTATNVDAAGTNWQMTGPQVDFRRNPVYAGALYCENTPMQMLVWQGQVVESFGTGSKKLLGSIGNPSALAEASVKANDWNQITVIARGGTLIHIVNGQIMAVLVDDDPNSPNNQPGFFGIQLEPRAKVYVRNVWMKKFN